MAILDIHLKAVALSGVLAVTLNEKFSKHLYSAGLSLLLGIRTQYAGATPPIYIIIRLKNVQQMSPAAACVSHLKLTSYITLALVCL